MKKVLINIEFKDVYTGKLYKAGEYVNMTDERIAEIKAVNSNFVTVVGLAPTKPAVAKGKSGKKDKEPETKESEEKEPSADELIEELEQEEVEE